MLKKCFAVNAYLFTKAMQVLISGTAIPQIFMQNLNSPDVHE